MQALDQLYKWANCTICDLNDDYVNKLDPKYLRTLEGHYVTH